MNTNSQYRTSLPWKKGAYNPMTSKVSIYHEFSAPKNTSTNGVGSIRVAECLGGQCSELITKANADFITEACNNYEALKQENKVLREAMNPHEDVKGCYPLILYFSDKAQANEFVELVKEAKPGMRSYSI